MRIKFFTIIFICLIFQLKICTANNHETIEEFLNKKIEVIRRITGSTGRYDQMMSESDAEVTARRERYIEDPLESVGELKLILKNRLPAAISADRTVKSLKENKSYNLHIANKNKLRTGHSKLSFSKVNKVFLPFNLTTTTKRLNEELVESNVLISELKSSMNRSSQMRADDDSGVIDMKNVKVEDLILDFALHPFQDALLSSQSPLVFSEEKILESLSTGQMTVVGNKINRIDLNKLLNSTSTKQVTGEKVFNSLTVKELTIDETFMNIPQSVLKIDDDGKLNASKRIEFQGDINVKHLKVKAINRLNLTAFMSDVLLRSSEGDLILNGDLIAENLINVDNLRVNSIAKIPANNFMTVNGDQSISSSVFISKFYTSSLTSPIINGEEISSATIATTNTPNIITSYTRFMDISIIRNLNVEGVQGFVENLKRHVIGTKASDLFQLYNGRVVIQGSLQVQNIQFESLNTNVFVGNMKIFQNLLNSYWMKSIKQNILAPIFVINNEVSATAGVVIASLNGQPMEKFMLINVERPQGTAWLRFDDVIVKGDVKGHKSNEPSRIFLLSSTVVRRNSQTPIEILGNVEFRNELIVKRLRAGLINSIQVNSLIHKNQQTIVMEAPVIVNSLTTSLLFVDRDLLINTYNNVELAKLAENFLKLSQGIIKIDSIIMERFEAVNLQVNNFEGIPLDAMVSKLQQEFDTGAVRERILTINGDVTFNKNIFVERINSETIVNEFFSSLASKSEEEILKLGGRKIFENGLEVKHLFIEELNSHSAYRLFNQSLSRGVKQTIKEPITIRRLEVDSLHTNAINNHYWNAFVSKKSLSQPLFTNLQLDQLIVGDLTTNFAVYDLNTMIQSILFPKRSYWGYINVTKETTALLSPSSELYQLFTFGVDNRSPQDILGKVNVNAQQFFIKDAFKPTLDMNTRTMAINLHQLIHDSVKNYAKHAEVIYGPKTIPRGNRFDANNLKIDTKCSFISNDINGINIMQLNKTFYRGGNLTGNKHFNYLHVDEFKIKSGRINGINPKDIITPASNLFYGNFEKLEIRELHTYSLNGYSFQYFLENRLRKYGKEQVFGTPIMMKSAHFEDDTVMPYINDVPIEACLFSKSDQLQDILPHVIVNGKITFIGPVHITAINGEDFRRQLDDSISRHQPFSCNKLRLNDVELKNGLKISGIINNREIKELLESDAHSPKLVDLMSLISNIQKQESIIDSSRSLKNSKQRMIYLDTDDNINTQYKMLRSHDDGDEPVCSGSEIDFEPHARGLVVTRTSNLIFEMPSMKAEVFLPCGKSNLEVTWNYKNNQGKFNQSFADYGRDITNNDIYIFESIKGDNFIAVKIDSSVVLLKLDKSSHKWLEVRQSSQSELTGVRIISVVQTPQLETLLVFIKHTCDSLMCDDIYIHNFADEFKNLHKIPANTKFDIALNLNIANSTFLIFAKTNDRKVFIYRLNRDTKRFVFQQLLDEKFDDIVSVIVLQINDEPFIVISKKSGVFCFYQWRGIENWQQTHCGKFRNLQLMKSFQYLNKQRIFLASSINSNVDNTINALVIHKQGGSS